MYLPFVFTLGWQNSSTRLSYVIGLVDWFACDLCESWAGHKDRSPKKGVSFRIHGLYKPSFSESTVHSSIDVILNIRKGIVIVISLTAHKEWVVKHLYPTWCIHTQCTAEASKITWNIQSHTSTQHFQYRPKFSNPWQMAWQYLESQWVRWLIRFIVYSNELFYSDQLYTVQKLLKVIISMSKAWRMYMIHNFNIQWSTLIGKPTAVC
jgi:hypothetical protein